MVADGFKEVRFTRARQSIAWMVASAVSLAVILILVACQLLPEPWKISNIWLFSSILISLLCIVYFLVTVVIRCVRRAYLIFSPVGVEIFPWKKPEQNLDVVMWSEIDHMEIRGWYLYLHFNAEETAGKVVSLKPVLRRQRELIRKIVEARA